MGTVSKPNEDIHNHVEGIVTFDIADEFRITDEMETGKRYDLSKDAFIVVRSFQSKTYLKGISKIKDANPDKSNTDILIMSIAEYAIVDICNVTIDGKLVVNTYESKMDALEFQSTDDSNGPFVNFILQKAQIKNFEGAGNSLMQTA